jgi:cation diffusion facilitator family transporter
MAAGHGEGGRRAIIAALFANFAIAIAKFVAFLVTRASSMLAESIHSVADTGNQALLLLGGARARREPSPEHPFGYGRVRYFWAFIVALVLFSLGGVFAIYEAIEKFRHPHELESPQWAIGVLVVAIVLESFSFRTAVVEAEKVRDGRTWWGFIRTAKAPELPVVLLEDLGALTGLVLALIGVGTAAVTGDSVWDALGTLSIGLLLVAIAWILAVEMKSLLIGEAAGVHEQGILRRALEEGDDVRRVIHMRTEHLGPEDLLVAAKIEFDPTLSVAELADAIDAAEARMRAVVPMRLTVYMEPDLYEARAAAPGPG